MYQRYETQGVAEMMQALCLMPIEIELFFAYIPSRTSRKSLFKAGMNNVNTMF